MQTQVYGLRLPVPHVQALRKLARELSVERDADIRWSMLVRSGIERLLTEQDVQLAEELQDK